MTKEAKKASKIEKKLKILLGGYQVSELSSRASFTFDFLLFHVFLSIVFSQKCPR